MIRRREVNLPNFWVLFRKILKNENFGNFTVNNFTHKICFHQIVILLFFILITVLLYVFDVANNPIFLVNIFKFKDGQIS